MKVSELEKIQIRQQGQLDALEIKVKKLTDALLDLLRIIYTLLGKQDKVLELGCQIKSWNEKVEEKAVSKKKEEVSNVKKGKGSKGYRKG